MNTTTLITAEQMVEMPAGAVLDGGPLLPGFRCPIADLFANPRGPESDAMSLELLLELRLLPKLLSGEVRVRDQGGLQTVSG